MMGQLMAGFSRFEAIEAWRRARNLTKETYALTSAGSFSRDFGLIDQMRRAAVSIMSNIAEGFGRGGNKEFVQFLWVAKDSASELQAQCDVALDAGYIDQCQFQRCHTRCEEISKMLAGLIAYLSQAHPKGARYAQMTQNLQLRTQNSKK
jgi:four helix bundle protein